MTSPGNTTPPQPGPSERKPQQQTTTPPSTLSNDMQTNPATHRERPRTLQEKRAAFIEIIADSWMKKPKGGGPAKAH